MFRIKLRGVDAANVFLINNGAQALLMDMIFTAVLVYRVTVAHLDALQLVLVGTALEASVFLFEVPTGIVADVYSRRTSIIIGVLITGVAFLIEGSLPTFAAIAFAEALWGFGYTFTSGATAAWMVDEVGEERAGRLFLRSTQVENVAGAAGIVLAMALGAIDLRLPILLGGAAFLALGAYLVAAMRETGFSPAPRDDHNPLRHMVRIFGEGIGAVRGKPLLVTILAITVIAGAASEGFDRLSTPHFIAIGWPALSLPVIGSFGDVQWYGLIRIAIMALTLAASRVAEKRLNTASHRALTLSLAGLTAVIAVSVIGFGLAPTFVAALGTYLVARTARALAEPLGQTWINQHVESRVRATVLSMNGQLDALGQIALGPLFGWLGVARSLGAALVASGAALSPALLLYGRALREGPGMVEEEAVAEAQEA